MHERIYRVCPSSILSYISRLPANSNPPSLNPLACLPGGDLRLVNMKGYGVDAYLSLRRLEGGEWQEGLAEQGTQPYEVSSHFDYSSGSEGRTGDPGPPGAAPI